MEIHKPKPIHSFREFLKEVGTIVLGVCIALAAEQAVEWWHWRGQVAEARQIITAEMARNISYGIERLQSARCAEARLQAVGKVLDAASRTGALPPLGDIGALSLRPWSSGAWDSVVASQTATHFPRQQLAALSLIYQRVIRVENWNRQETDAWSILKTLSGSGRRFDPATEADMRKALGLAVAYDYVIVTSSERLIQGAMELDLPFSADETRLLADALKSSRNARPNNCKPLSATPILLVGIDDQALSRLDQTLQRLPWAAHP